MTTNHRMGRKFQFRAAVKKIDAYIEMLECNTHLFFTAVPQKDGQSVILPVEIERRCCEVVLAELRKSRETFLKAIETLR